MMVARTFQSLQFWTQSKWFVTPIVFYNPIYKKAFMDYFILLLRWIKWNSVCVCVCFGGIILTPGSKKKMRWLSVGDMSGKCVNVSDNNIQYIWSRLSGWLGGIKLTKTFSRDYKTSWEKILVDFSSFIVSNFWPGMSGYIKLFLLVLKFQLKKKHNIWTSQQLPHGGWI